LCSKGPIHLDSSLQTLQIVFHISEQLHCIQQEFKGTLSGFKLYVLVLNFDAFKWANGFHPNWSFHIVTHHCKCCT
jgi:hypothetical protein